MRDSAAEMAKTKAGGAATATPPATPKKQTGGITKPKKGKATPTPKKGKSKGKDDDDENAIRLAFRASEARLLERATDDAWKPGKNRYERCGRGGQCLLNPLAAQPIGLFYLDYHHVHPTVDDEDDSDIGKEKKNRRIASKTILEGIF
ncbi:hypothetical protein FPHYL_12258 [Fusarium phyllophilum]|uniref:Uncharacterized protein n=1 Tax=Fusarium phyllophilum TaxID=47803 RepID=A0A8H5IMR1_9HYPO|nr:hypothetical protein FPHYL_12258 [Fusarium phyllophilum]